MSGLNLSQEKRDKLSKIFTEKHFIKKNIIYLKKQNTPKRYYLFFAKRYFMISAFLSFASFLLVVQSHMVIMEKNSYQETFITNTNGQSFKYENNESRKETIRKTLDYIKNNK